MTRPKRNPLPEAEQSKQRTKNAAMRLREAGGRVVTVRVPDAHTAALLSHARAVLHTESDSETFLELLRRFDAKIP